MKRSIILLLSILSLAACESGGLYANGSDSGSYSSGY